MSQAEFRHCYGVAGVNYEAWQLSHKGDSYDILASFPNNAYGQQEAAEYQAEFKDNAQLILHGEKLVLFAR